jgi:DNA-binding NarL/FixJ family response regulator
VNPVGGTPLRVLIVDDDVPTRIGLQTIFETEADIEVVGEAADGHEACMLAGTLSPDVVLMDVRLPRLDGITATRRIVDALPAGPRRVRVVVLTTFDDEVCVGQALEAGASAVLLKRLPAEELVGAVRAVAALPDDEEPARIGMGRRAQPQIDHPPASALAQLTEREREVLVLMAHGRSNQEIAALLTISGETVKTHVKRIFMKLGIHDRGLAIVAAYEHGLVIPGNGHSATAVDKLRASDGPTVTPSTRPFSAFPR